MTPKEQERFVCALVNSVKHRINLRIRRGEIPDHWDRHFLREYLYDCFTAARSHQLPKDRKMRVKYRNDVVEHNL